MIRTTPLLALAFTAGCQLYFGHGSGDDMVPPDTEVSAECGSYGICRGGDVYDTGRIGPSPTCPPTSFPPATTFVAHCPDGCAEGAAAFCDEVASCTAEDAAKLCNTPPPPPPPTFTCTLDGQSCSAPGQTEGCAATTACEGLVSVGDCTCGASGTWACTPACADGACSPGAVQSKLTGTWEGTVDPPSFSGPWSVHLTIDALGRWSGSCSGQPYCLPFYYGGTSGRITVQEQTNIGAFAAIEFGFGSDILGLMRPVRVTSTTLRFTFIDSWLDCSRPFIFDLHRVP